MSIGQGDLTAFRMFGPRPLRKYHSACLSQPRFLKHKNNTTIMAPVQTSSSRIAASVNDYTVLPLSIPPTSSFPVATKHYLYLRPNAPKIPTDNTPRELFVVNLPIDATETHLRALFATHGGGARVERVEFEGARTGKKVTAPVTSKSGKKRKRGGDGEAKAVELPEMWDRSVGRSGNTCVVVFVDTAAAELALKEVKKVIKSAKEVVWGSEVGDKVPALGAASEFCSSSLFLQERTN
jgi:ribosomal RNA-processing protein 7